MKKAIDKLKEMKRNRILFPSDEKFIGMLVRGKSNIFLKIRYSTPKKIRKMDLQLQFCYNLVKKRLNVRRDKRLSTQNL